MNPLKTNHFCSSRCLLVQMTIAALAVLALASVPVARASEDNLRRICHLLSATVAGTGR